MHFELQGIFVQEYPSKFRGDLIEFRGHFTSEDGQFFCGEVRDEFGRAEIYGQLCENSLTFTKWYCEFYPPSLGSVFYIIQYELSNTGKQFDGGFILGNGRNSRGKSWCTVKALE